MFKINNVAKLLTGIGAMAVSIHTAGMLFVYCSGNVQCVASVNFGVAEYTGTPLLISGAGNVSGTTASVSDSAGLFSLADVHTLVQTVGLYLILIGISLMLVLELRELRLLRSFQRARR